MAEFADLSRMAEIDTSLYGNGVNHIWKDMKDAIDPEEQLDYEEASQSLFGSQADRDEDWLIAFVEGAQELFAKVEGEI